MMYLHLMKNKKYGYVFPDIVLEGKEKTNREKFNLFEQFFLNQSLLYFISKEILQIMGFMMKIGN